ncbi:MAG: tetratricopeptide repeat protein [Armatimonadota bacterium]
MSRNGQQSRRRSARKLAFGVLLLLALAIPLDLFVTGRDARARWISALPPGAVRQLGRSFPQDPPVLFALARSQRNQGDSAAAVETLRRATELDPTFQLGRGEYADTLIDVGRTAEARSISRECLMNHPEVLPALVAEGRLYASRNEWREAARSAAEALQVAPTSPDAWLLQARVDAGQNRWQEAAAAASRVSGIGSRQWEARVIRAEAAMELGDFTQAVEHAEAAVALRPVEHRAQTCLARALLQVGEPGALERARGVAAEAVRLAPLDRQALLAAASVEVAQSRWDTAREQLETILQGWPDANDARLLLSRVAKASGDLAAARRWTTEHLRWEKFLGERDMLLERVRAVPYDPQPWVDLAVRYQEFGMWTEARRAAGEALKKTRDPGALALMHSLLGGKEKPSP